MPNEQEMWWLVGWLVMVMYLSLLLRVQRI